MATPDKLEFEDPSSSIKSAVWGHFSFAVNYKHYGQDQYISYINLLHTSTTHHISVLQERDVAQGKRTQDRREEAGGIKKRHSRRDETSMQKRGRLAKRESQGDSSMMNPGKN
ncbi:unnamed protein product [Pleuronectes platessa]|uniref:Uncharacterized protein n=1 Tax=Pleuronectes platessa TaxID=8262 RepID=A0A9N7UGY6_PLEPL|nr:unnamed protein product [Pleuronectes platessa]